jgi:hypothetical protein
MALALSYEAPEAQAEAKKAVPIERLEGQARQKMESTAGADFRDFLLSELTQWFKTEFFSWCRFYDFMNLVFREIFDRMSTKHQRLNFFYNYA